MGRLIRSRLRRPKKLQLLTWLSTERHNKNWKKLKIATRWPMLNLPSVNSNTILFIKIHDAHCEETIKYCNHNLFLIQLLTFFVYRHVVLIIVYGLLILYP